MVDLLKKKTTSSATFTLALVAGHSLSQNPPNLYLRACAGFSQHNCLSFFFVTGICLASSTCYFFGYS